MRVELGERVARRARRGGADVLLEVAQALGAGDRDDVLALGEHPGDGDLRRRRAEPLGDRARRARRSPGSARAPRAGSAGSGGGSRPRRSSSRPASLPVRKPRPSGAKATKATSCSAHQGSTSASASRVHSESSDCSAAIGWIAAARSSVGTSTSESPSARTLPSATSSAIDAVAVLDRHLGVDAVQVVEVDHVDAEPLQRGLAGLADVLGPAVLAEHVVRASPRRRGRPWSRPRRSSRRPASARPTSCSFVNGPYTSEVSRNVTPSSSARWMTATDSLSSPAP